MKSVLTWAGPVLAAAVAGGLLGTVATEPYQPDPAAEAQEVDWSLAKPPQYPLDDALAFVEQRRPWGETEDAAADDGDEDSGGDEDEAAADNGEEDSAPVWRFVGTSRQGGELRAHFLADNGDTRIVAPGDEAPMGGRVTTVQRAAIKLDAEGETSRLRLFQPLETDDSGQQEPESQ